MPTITIRATNSQGFDDWTLDYDVIDGVIRVRASNSEGSDDWTLPYTIQGGTPPPPPPATGPLVALVGQDTAGGTITGGGQSWVTIDGRAVTVVGDSVQSSSAMSAGADPLHRHYGAGQFMGYNRRHPDLPCGATRRPAATPRRGVLL